MSLFEDGLLSLRKKLVLLVSRTSSKELSASSSDSSKLKRNLGPMSYIAFLDHVNNGKLTLNQLINLMCENPCRIFGIKNKGFIKEGYDADFTIVDMNKEVTIKNEMIASKCGWTPFHNFKVKGFPVGTIINGILVMSDGNILVESKGKPLKF